MRLSRDSDSEVDVRLVMLDLSARADGADALTLLDRVPTRTPTDPRWMSVIE